MSDQTGPDSSDRPDQPADPGAQPPAASPYGQGQPPPAPYGQQGPAQPSPYAPPPASGQPPYPQQSGHEPSTYGQPAYGQPAYGQPAFGQPGYGQPAYGGPGDPDKRPGTVTAAGVITLISSGLSLLLFGVVLVGLLVARDAMVEEFENTAGLQDIDPDDVITVTIVAMVVLVVWCLLAMVLAVFAMRRSNGARIGLVVSAGLTAVVSLISITSLVSVVPLAAAVATIVCLFVGGAGAWFSGSPGDRSGGGGWQSSPVA